VSGTELGWLAWSAWSRLVQTGARVTHRPLVVSKTPNLSTCPGLSSTVIQVRPCWRHRQKKQACIRMKNKKKKSHQTLTITRGSSRQLLYPRTYPWLQNTSTPSPSQTQSLPCYPFLHNLIRSFFIKAFGLFAVSP
jgi:hypothetical protein